MKRLGELLLERDWVQRGDLLRAMRQQQQVGGRLGTCLLEMGTISEEELGHVLGVQHGLDPVTVDEIRNVPEEVRSLLPTRSALRCKAVPVKASASKVHVAMVDPRDLACQDELSFAIGRRLIFRACPEVRVLEALERYYEETMPKRVSKLVDRLNRQRFMWREGEGEGHAAPPAPAGRAGDLFPANPSLEPPDFPEPPGAPRVEYAPPPAAPLPAAPPAAADDTAPVPGQAGPGPAAPESAGQSPARLAAVHLSEGERAALYGGRAPAPVTYEAAAERLEGLEERDAVATLVVDFLRQEFDRVLLFAVRRDEVAGWTGDGGGLDPGRVAPLSIPLSQPSIFLNLRQGSAFHLGPLPSLPAHRPLVALLGGEAPDECLVLPVRLGGRMVATIYCDKNGEPLGGVDLEDLRRFADQVAQALGRCILLKRQAQA